MGIAFHFFLKAKTVDQLANVFYIFGSLNPISNLSEVLLIFNHIFNVHLLTHLFE